MDFRHEWKIEINPADLLALRSRLRALMAPDAPFRSVPQIGRAFII